MEEVKQLFDNVLELANSTHGGKHLFAGQKTITEPFQRVSSDPSDPDYYMIEYHGGRVDEDTASLKVEINSNTVIDLNVIQASIPSGGTTSDAEDQLFMPILAVLAGIISDIRRRCRIARGARLGELDQALDGLLTVRAEVGAKLSRIELADARLKDLHLNSTNAHQYPGYRCSGSDHEP